MSVTIPFEAATSSTSGYGDIGVYADTWTTMNASASARPSRRADTWTKTIQLPANAKAARRRPRSHPSLRPGLERDDRRDASGRHYLRPRHSHAWPALV